MSVSFFGFQRRKVYISFKVLSHSSRKAKELVFIGIIHSRKYGQHFSV